MLQSAVFQQRATVLARLGPQAAATADWATGHCHQRRSMCVRVHVTIRTARVYACGTRARMVLVAATGRDSCLSGYLHTGYTVHGK